MRQIGTRKQPAKTHLSPKVNRKAPEFSTFLRRFPLSIFKSVHLFPLSMNKLLITLKNPRHFPFSIHILLKVVENYRLTLIKPALGGFKAVKIVKMSVNNPEFLKRSNMMETTVDQINPVADDCGEGPSTESVLRRLLLRYGCCPHSPLRRSAQRPARHRDPARRDRRLHRRPRSASLRAGSAVRRNHPLHRREGSLGELHPRSVQGDHRLHPRSRQHHSIRRPRPRHQLQGQGAAPRLLFGDRPMKSYIRGVGSGLPIVREYLEFSHGTISIEDNMGSDRSSPSASIQIELRLERTRFPRSTRGPPRSSTNDPSGRGGRTAGRCLGRSAFWGALRLRVPTRRPCLRADPRPPSRSLRRLMCSRASLARRPGLTWERSCPGKTPQ